MLAFSDKGFGWRNRSQSPMVFSMLMRQRIRLSRGGQISIPAKIRRRWGTSTFALDDRGDHLVLEPAADDPIAAADGALAEEFGHVDPTKLRRAARASEEAAEPRRRA